MAISVGGTDPNRRLAWPYVEPPQSATGVGQDVRLVHPPFDAVDLLPAESGLERLQFDSMPDARSLDALAEWVANHPHVEIRAYGFSSGGFDPVLLDALHKAQAVALDIRSSMGEITKQLHRLSPDLVSLDLGAGAAALNIEGLAYFRSLTGLTLEGPLKRPDVLRELGSVVDLTLRSVKLPDLEALRSMTGLRNLDIKLGSVASLEPIADIGEIEHLSLWQLRGLTDLSALSAMPHLQRLSLESLKNVTALPDLSATPVQRIDLTGLKGVDDLAPLAAASSLREVHLSEMPHVRWPAVAPLADHPTLDILHASIGHRRAEAEIQEAFAALPPAQHRPRLVTSSTSNMRQAGASKKAPRAGDVFEFQMPDGLYSFGRVIDPEATFSAGVTCLLVYIFRGRFATPTLDRAALKTTELLLPPTLTNKRGWTAGCFRTIANLDIARDERLPVHAFRQSARSVVDVDGNPLPPGTSPNADLQLVSYLGIDDRVSRLHGIPPVIEP